MEVSQWRFMSIPQKRFTVQAVLAYYLFLICSDLFFLGFCNSSTKIVTLMQLLLLLLYRVNFFLNVQVEIVNKSTMCPVYVETR